MSQSEWQQIHDKFNIILRAHRTYVEKPQESWLDAYEEEMGFKLPQSYRDFILVWGPGEFGTCVRIASPGYAGQGHTVDLPEMHAGFDRIRRSSVTSGDKCAESELAQRLVAFGDDGFGGNSYCWDPQDVRNAETNEYAIYAVHLNWPDSLDVEATSFREFIMQRAIDPPNPIDEDDADEDSDGDCRFFNPASPAFPECDEDDELDDSSEAEFGRLFDEVGSAVRSYLRTPGVKRDRKWKESLVIAVIIHLSPPLEEIIPMERYERMPTPEELQGFLTWWEDEKGKES